MAVSRLFVEIGGDTSKLDAALKASVANAQNAGLEVKKAGERFIQAFDAALNPTTKFEQQLKLLTSAGKSNADIMAVMGDKIKAAIDTATRNNQPISDLVKKFGDMGTESGKAKFSIEGFGAALKDFANNPVGAARAGIAGFLEKLGPVAIGIGGIATAVVAGGAALFKMASDTANEIEQLQNLANTTGTTIQQVQSLTKAAELMGVSGEAVTSSITKLNAQLGKTAGGDFTRGLVALGISLDDVSGKAKGPVQLLGELRDKLMQVADPAERAELAMGVLGNRNQELAKLLLSTDDNWLKLAGDIEREGGVFGDEAVKSAKELDRSLDELSQKFQPFKVKFLEMTVGIANGLLSLTEGQTWKNFFGALASGVTATGAANVAGALNGVATATKGVAAATDQATAATTKQNEAVRLAALHERELFNEQMKMLASGQKHIELRQKIAEEEKKLQQLLDKGTKEEVQNQANVVRALRDKLAQIERNDTGIKKHAAEIDKLNQQQYKEWLESLSKIEKQFPASFKRMEDALSHFSDVATETAQLPLFSDWIEPKIDFSKATADNENFLQNMSDTMVSSADAIEMKLKEGGEQGGKECRNAFLNQVSTIGTDLSKKLVDGIMSGKLSIIDAIKDIGGSLLRALMETFITPFINNFVGAIGKLFSGGGGGGFSLGNLFSGIFGGTGGGGIGGQTGGLSGSNLLKAGANTVLPGAGTLLGFLGLGGGSAIAASAAASGAAFTAGSALMAPGMEAMVASMLGGSLVPAGAAAGGAAAGGAAAGGSAAGGGSMMSSLGAFMTNPITIAIAGGLAATLLGIKFATGKSSYEAGGMEVARDLGVTGVGKQTVKDFFNAVGMSEASAWDIRKDLLSSPKFLAEWVAPMAAATGQMDALYASLSKVTTSWGTFDFAEAFKVGQATGDWSALDKAFIDAFEHSDRLRQMMPDFASKLTMTGDAAKDAADSTKDLADSTDDASESLARANTTIRDAGASVTSLGDDYARLGLSARDAAGLLDSTAGAFDRTSVAADGAHASIMGIGDAIARAATSLRDYAAASASFIATGNAFGIPYDLAGRQNVNEPTFIPSGSGSGASSLNRDIALPMLPISSGGSDRSGIGSFHQGTDYVPHTGLWLLQQGERVIPANRNQQASLVINFYGDNYGFTDLESNIVRIIASARRRGVEI